jgi:peptide/nickel transport system ATP-binding protein
LSALLDVVDLSVEFGALRVLAGVSFALRAGEILGIVGESGAGKTVTAHAIFGLLGPTARVTSGRADFDGRDLLALRRGEIDAIRGRDAAIVFQNPSAALNPIRSVGAQIADVLARHLPAPPDLIRRQTIEALRRVRIADPERLSRALPFELSGGMRQRVGIAIALACAPRLLIADEPTTGLDVIAQGAIMGLIGDMARKRNMGVILITHDLALASRYCDSIAVMHAGHVVEAGPSEALFSHPRHPYTVRHLRSAPANVDSIEALESEPPDWLRAAAEPNDWTRSDRRLLEADGLVKTYPMRRGGRRSRLHAVDDVDLTIRPGEAVGLVGESGCGKSTLARLVSRLIAPDGGALRFEGASIDATSIGRFAASSERRQIQMVFQDPANSLNPHFSAFEAIADPVRVLVRPKSRAELERRVAAAADQAGLPKPLLSRLPHQLSGGEKARVGIARAMAVEPKLLILDEPTSSLDVSTQAMVLKLLSKLRREAGVALLFVSHDLDVVRLVCDRVMVMVLGKIVETGPVKSVFAAPLHPYTRALISAVPRIGRRQEAAHRLDGEPLSPVDPDPGACRLHGRCPVERDICAIEPPRLRALAPGREARCHFPLALSTPV